jgi:hypothetical protein
VDRKWRRKPLESHETDSKVAASEGVVGDLSDKKPARARSQIVDGVELILHTVGPMPLGASDNEGVRLWIGYGAIYVQGGQQS